MSTNPFLGVGVAVVTPFQPSGEVDFSALEKIIDFLVSGGVDYIVTLGTTSETPTLSREEETEILEKTLSVVNKRIPLVVNTSSNCTKEMLDFLENPILQKFDGFMSVCPYYNRPSQRGVFTHFAELAKRTDKPIMLYNIPKRTGTPIAWETMVKLSSEFPNIMAIKEASGDFAHINNLLVNKPKHLEIISGDDPLSLPIWALGGKGVVSVIGNILPELLVKMYRSFCSGDLANCLDIHGKQIKLLNLLFKEGSPAGVKSVMAGMGLCANVLRSPLERVSAELEKELWNEFEKVRNC